jgi:hypothetical protein
VLAAGLSNVAAFQAFQQNLRPGTGATAALGTWKPAKDAGSHIPTAPSTAAVKLDKTVKPPQIARFSRFSLQNRIF